MISVFLFMNGPPDIGQTIDYCLLKHRSDTFVHKHKSKSAFRTLFNFSYTTSPDFHLERNRLSRSNKTGKIRKAIRVALLP